MVNQMRRRFVRDVLSTPGRYTHVIVFGGVNDVYSDLTAGRTPQKIEQDLGWMYEQARGAGLQVVALTIAPWGGFKRYFNTTRANATREINDWIRSQAPVDAVIDAYSLLSCGDAESLCPEYAAPFKDGIHFGKLGHEVLAEQLYAQVFSGCL
jgi:lysophospholipase L1-like esterase